MIYSINPTDLYDLIDEEISRVATEAYGEDAKFLYDSVVLHSGDRNEISRLQGDAMNTLIVRLHDIVTILPDDEQGNHRLEFFVPDLDTSLEASISKEITNFIAMNVASAWFQSHAADRAPEFAARGQVSLDKASALLHTRRKPKRI